MPRDKPWHREIVGVFAGDKAFAEISRLGRLIRQGKIKGGASCLCSSILWMNVLSYTTEAQARFAELKPHCPRLKTMDLRIASIALVTDSILLSRNLRDFRQVPGLSVQDWTIN